MITETSVSDNTTIERYIDLLVDAFGIPDEVPYQKLKGYFDAGNYPKCVQYIRNTMRVYFHLNVKSLDKETYNDSTSLARIMLPANLHRIEKQFQATYHINMEIRSTYAVHFSVFTQSVSHEVAHLVLAASDHQLKHSEVATDLCTLVFGFGKIVQESHHTLARKGRRGGYLTYSQFQHAMWYLNKVRHRKEGLPFTTPAPGTSLWRRIIHWLFN